MNNQKLLTYSPVIWPVDDDDNTHDNTPADNTPTDRPPFDVLLALALSDVEGDNV